jgi:hypothetical protein
VTVSDHFQFPFYAVLKLDEVFIVLERPLQSDTAEPIPKTFYVLRICNIIAVTQHAVCDQLHESCVWMMRAYSGDLVSWYFKHIHSLWSHSEIAKSESVLHSTMVIILMKLVNGSCIYFKAIAG